MKAEVNGRKIKIILIKVLVLNWFVALMKVVLGYFTRSASILADGFHSFADGTSNIVGLVGIHMAYKPRDKGHPYGHRKIENFTAIFIAMMLFLVSFELVERAVGRILKPADIKIDALSFLVMGVATLINYFVTAYEYKKGLALKSDILVADSYHTKSDIYVSLVVMVSMLGVALGFPFLDGIVSFLIAILIARMAIEILKSTSRVLCDSAVLASESLRSAVMSVKGVIDCHEVRTRGREDEVLVDLHIHVDRSMHVDDAHDISSEIENLIKTKFSGVKEVIVHIEPTRDK